MPPTANRLPGEPSKIFVLDEETKCPRVLRVVDNGDERGVPSTAPVTSGQPTRILIIGDETSILTHYTRILSRAGHTCLCIIDPSQLETHLTKFQPNLVLTDLAMHSNSNMEILDRVYHHHRRIPVIVVTAHGTVENAVEAMRHHAADFMTKPFAVEDLLAKIQRSISEMIMRSTPSANHRRQPQSEDWQKDVLGKSHSFLDALELARKVAQTDVNVLIFGESGTGKEVLARAIHRMSQRRKEILVPVDCASFPENLLESEFFGYRKGAFTGATSDKMGLFEFAHKGTLFLDEIGEMPLALQVKLLRGASRTAIPPRGRSRGD